MDKKRCIIIADRNRHIREFLRREFIQEGFAVKCAGDDRALLLMLAEAELPDLLILDPEIMFSFGLEIIKALKNCVPGFPVVIHTCRTNFSEHPIMEFAAALVEKTGDPAPLKNTVSGVLGYNRPFEKETRESP